MLRDPRVDPRPGDEIFRPSAQAKGGGIIRIVTKSHGAFVFYSKDNGYARTFRREPLSKWIRWAQSAEVLYGAD